MREQGKFKEAATDYEQVFQLKPANHDLLAAAYYGHGMTAAAKREWDTAMTDYQTALTLKPDFAEAKTRLGEVEKRRGAEDAKKVNPKVKTVRK